MAVRRTSLAAALSLLALASLAGPARADGPPSPEPSSSAPVVPIALPAPSTMPTASERAPAHHGVETKGASARIHDRPVFEILVSRGGQSPERRASEATKVLERLVDEAEAPEVRVQEEGDTAVVYGGSTPIVQLEIEDARAAEDPSLQAHANAVAAKVRAALRAERQRSAIATTVFSVSLLVFSGLLAFLFARKVVELLERLRAWLDENPHRLPALRVQGIEVVQPAAVRGSLAVALGLATLVARISILYAWVLIALSRFDATRVTSEKLTDFLLAPVSALAGRVTKGIPLVLIAGVTVVAVGITLRFVRLFFGSIARGETTVGWLPRDLAEPTGILVRAGVVVSTLVVAAPLVTGADDGVLSRAGVVALISIGLAATPVLACAATGIAVVFGRRLRVGAKAGVGGREGRVLALSMLEVKLEDEDGASVHVPHLMSLWQPTRVIGSAALVSAEVSLAPEADLAVALEVLKVAAATVGTRVRVEILGLDGRGAHLRVGVAPARGGDRNALYVAIASALRAAGIGLGEPRAFGDRRGGRAPRLDS